MQDDEGIVGIGVARRRFGVDWRYPIASKFNEIAERKRPL
jgi:hypothetical protein